jgi:polyhydroxyalkanoate synthesis regulator protein
MEYIVRYEKNRRLYSSKTKKFVKLSHIKSLVKDNKEFKVINKSDKTDITTEILNQVINQIEFDRQTLIKLIKES